MNDTYIYIQKYTYIFFCLDLLSMSDCTQTMFFGSLHFIQIVNVTVKHQGNGIKISARRESKCMEKNKPGSARFCRRKNVCWFLEKFPWLGQLGIQDGDRSDCGVPFPRGSKVSILRIIVIFVKVPTNESYCRC